MSDTTTIVIFGASGDLTKRKLVPALYNLYRKDRLPEQINIVGNSRTKFSHEEWRERMREGVEEFSESSFDQKDWDEFSQFLWYEPGDASKKKDMAQLQEFIQEKEGGAANRMYYLSVAPDLYAPIVQNIGAMDMAKSEDGWCRIVIEKPFGTDLESAQELNREVHEVFDESQVYRIDHYLGKETAQNIMFLRFANAIFEPVWNRNYVDSVQITASETVDVGHRGDYYDSSGVFRDMFQNHLLQLLTLIAMEPPPSFDADLMRNEKVKLLKSVRPIDILDTVAAQYEGYLDTKGVDPHSHTPTYGAIKLHIDNWRWQGVPFYLRSGKGLSRKVTEINVVFRQPPHRMFDNDHISDFKSNSLSICVQPDEGIHLTFEAKEPDTAHNSRSVDMEFHYADSFGKSAIPEAYERLLLDALLGDASLFSRSDGIEAAWELMDPIIEGWESDGAAEPSTYKLGSEGPQAADELLGDDGRVWRVGCLHDDC
ncbi:MAG: glucose-6-phosphate dehydrogenase [Anaerolineaceae bacterium]|nr:glucose-6-phosphate dehydrogenase [Anaerolineaceae bacterium]